MTTLNVQRTLAGLMKPKIAAQGFALDKDGNAVDAAKATADYMTMLAGLNPDPKEQAKIIIAAFPSNDPTGENRRQLSSIRLETVNNFIRVLSTIGTSFFDTVTLREDEEAWVYNDTKQEVRIGYLGEDGKPDRARVVKAEDKINIPLRILSTEIMRYRTLDLQKGRVDNVAKATFDMAADMAFKYDRVLFTLLNATVANGGAYGAFSTEQDTPRNGNKANKIWLAHSGILTSQLPLTNDIDLSANGSPDTTSFGLQVLRTIINYAFLWGNLLPDAGGQSLVPTGEVIVPAADIIGLAVENTPTVNVGAQRIQEELNKDGFAMLHYLGINWRFIPDHTIPSGVCYPRFNLLPGTVYLKPSMDKEFVETNERMHYEERDQQKVVGAYIKSQHRPRALRIRYIAE